MRSVHPGEAEPVSCGGARVRRGAAGARLWMLPRLRPEGRGALRNLHGAVRLRTEVHPKTRRPPAAPLPHPGTSRVHGERRTAAHPRAPDSRSGRTGTGAGQLSHLLGPRLQPIPPGSWEALRRPGEHESQTHRHPQETGGAGTARHRRDRSDLVTLVAKSLGERAGAPQGGARAPFKMLNTEAEKSLFPQVSLAVPLVHVLADNKTCCYYYCSFNPLSPGVSLQGPCHLELQTALDRISKAHEKLGEKLTRFYLPNCDKHGLYKQKQCESTLDGQKGRCWCVSSWNGKKLLGSSDLPSEADCR
uniref:Insulin-like growth factor binding protein 1a n=2 Tax=Nothobranchius furzeri TaxID=105023 RepID=A0A8C6LDH2_NOTFU